MTVRIPSGDGTVQTWAFTGAEPPNPPSQPPFSRRAYAALHVVADPSTAARGGPASLDWEATLAYRRHVWRYGLGVAEAMDTAQRGMGLGWETARELILQSGREAAACNGRIVAGAGTDQLPEGPATLDEVGAAWEEQCEVVESAGCGAVLMASRHLAAAASNSDEYQEVYGRVLSQVSGPVILHWLGETFDPALSGYWGEQSLDRAIEVFLSVVSDHADTVEGVKVSLLERDVELELRRRLPAGVRVYTGDDFNYPELIRGDDEGHSDALLGILDAIAPTAAEALTALDADDPDRFDEILAPTVPLSRHIFSSPTYFYKTGLTFLAYLNGHQGHFRMLDGLESARSVAHLSRLAVLADEARLIVDADQATSRLRSFLALAGFE